MGLQRFAPASSSRVSAALTLACRGGWVDGELTAAEVAELVVASRLHRVAPLVHIATREPAPAVSELVRQDRDDAFGRNLAAPLVLGELGRVLDDIRWLTFKGAVLSLTAHPAPGLRTFTDIDALVAPASLRSACERLAAAGWKLLDYDDMLAARPLPGEMHWLSPFGLGVDLHWSMINLESRRIRFSIPVESLIERRTTVSLGLAEVPALDPLDALVHVCVHSSLDGANRLLQLVDADALARQVTDWTQLAARAKEWRAGAQVWLVLSRSRALLDTPVPADLATLLGVPGGLRAFLSAVDRVTPVATVRSEHGFARLVARALRPGLAATGAAVVRNAVQGVFHRIRPPAARQDRIPARPETVQAFLAEVERQR